MYQLLDSGDILRSTDEFCAPQWGEPIFWEKVSDGGWDNTVIGSPESIPKGIIVRRELQSPTTIEEVNSWTKEQHDLVRRADTPKGIIINQFEMLMNRENTVDEFIQTITEFNNTWKQLGENK